MRRSVFLLLLSAALFASLAAQDPDQTNKLRLAEEFENAGMWDRALGIYEALHRAAPENLVFFDGLRRTYLQLKEYEKAIGLTRDRLRLTPDDPALRSSLAAMEYDAGHEATADSLWEDVLRTSGGSMIVYQIVAAEMLEHRLYEKAATTYLAGRAASGTDGAFTNELANLYLTLQQYPKAAEEFVRRLRAFPDQLPFVQSQVLSASSRVPALQQIVAVVRSEAERSPREVPVRRFLAWLYAEGRQYDAAVREIQAVDDLVHASGGEIFAYAQRLLQEHANASAARAFAGLLDGTPNPALVPSARFGYARALEALSADSASGTSPADVIQLYGSVAADYPSTDLAPQAQFRIGIICFDRLFDLNGALAAFQRVLASPRGVALRTDALLKTAEVDVARNDLARARTTYTDILAQGGGAAQDQAVFRLAELDYFEGAFDSSLAKLARFSTATSADLANDALMLRYFIEENATSAPRALAAVAAADLLLRQRKKSEALARLASVAAAYPQALLADDVQMRIGDIQAALGHADEALAAYRTVVDSLPASIWKDRAQFRIAELYETVRRDTTQAVAAYEQLLMRYPTSLYADEARRRVRVLRGDRLP